MENSTQQLIQFKITDEITLLEKYIFNAKNNNLNQKLTEWGNYYFNIKNLFLGLKFLSNINLKTYGEHLIHLYNQLFFQDLLNLKSILEKDLTYDELKDIDSEKFSPLYLEFDRIKSDFDFYGETLDEVNDSVVLKWLEFQFKTLHELISNKLKQLDERKEYSYTLIKRSEDFFNKGFFFLNSRTLIDIPQETVFKSNCDFKTRYFPSYKPVSDNCYRKAKMLFDQALENDPNNLAAFTFSIISELYDLASMHEEIPFSLLMKLEEMCKDHPENGLVNIELAHAFSLNNQFDKAKEQIESALKRFSNSAYVHYRAYSIIENDLELFGIDEKRGSNILNTAIINDPAVPIFFYSRALCEYKNDLIPNACLDIDKAIKVLGGNTDMDFFKLRNDIYLQMPSFGFRSKIYVDQEFLNDGIFDALSERENIVKEKYNL